MPDPTEPVITAAFCSALALFSLAAFIRKSRGMPADALEASAVPVLVSFPSPFPDSPYNPPATGEIPPPIPVGRVPTWYYRPLDLLGAFFIFLVFAGLVVLAPDGAEKAAPKLNPQSISATIVFQFLLAAIVTATLVSRVRPIQWLGLRWPGWRWAPLIAPAGVLTMWVFFGSLQASGYMQWIESFGVEAVQDTVKLFQSSTDPATIALMAVAAVVAAPICEEIVFRGYLYGVAKKFAGPWVAALCSALVFGAAHGSLAALLPLTVFGLLLVFVYEKTGSIWAPMAIHFAFNGSTVLIQLALRFHQISPAQGLGQ